MHIHCRATLLVQLTRQSDMIRMVVAQYNGIQGFNAQACFTQRCREGRSSLGYAHTGINQRPSMAAHESIQVDGPQWKGDWQCDFPDASSYLAGLR